MMPRKLFTRALTTALLLCALVPRAAFACAACFGKSYSPLAQGMNMGIFALLGVIGTVLAGVAGFFVFLARRSAQTAKANRPVPWAETTTPS